MRSIGVCLAAFATILFTTSAALATASCSKARVVVDLRADPVKPQIQISTAERERLAEDVFPGALSSFSVNSVAHGAFTSPTAHETLYLLQAGGPDATSPVAQDAVFAVYSEHRLLHTFTTRHGNFIEATVPVADGVDRVVLRSDQYQMGTSTTGLTVVQFGTGVLQKEAAFSGARIDRCGDERYGGDVEALVLSACEGREPQSVLFSAERFQAACKDGKAPPASAFRAMEMDAHPSPDSAPGKP